MTKSTPQSRKGMRARTKLVYAGREPSEQFGFVNTPIYRGSTVLFPDTASLEGRSSSRFRYGTYGTPTTEALEKAWSEISGAADTVLAPSGLAACCLAMLTALSSGDHVLVTDSAYGPTRSFCEHFLARMGIETTFYDPLAGANIEALFKPNTKAVLVEAPGSQTFEMQDIPAIAEVAHARDACVIMDNTWATPLFFPAHERGIDLSADAGTKYLSGHSDLLLGLVSANEKWAKRLRQTFQLFSNCAGPEDAWLALRGLRTMHLRLREAEKQGLALARWLENRPEVSRVLHPALESDPGHAIWKRDFLGSTGLFSAILKPASQQAVEAFLDGLELFGLGYSWGGYESLVIPFDCRSYRTATVWSPEGPALRFSVGLEDIEDLKADLDQGFARMRAQA
ncbi:cystathionine beta-lyase [Rhodoblastus acidophilus]|uniref:Cystathionine beta-lyase n=1 Tax=Candidatus Rhodoblastus alkanivorans TaxID=2954117 RepID=A0ABS9Z8W8_9HYPH|nr:cystathionine beta-lyase [Candidatus Rhodoblastus alkanivorans]MCI4678005.1 cystathionine beta-lyase [Candidatus Rhodoblastus alkanivorans]MCI4683900.1 cystathionine beta-lyase [Candidatus Rhodoblastus alkanivorans]MDI4641217.1 cystathionine beta-lyase [Rhodoblastus acidophilus]